MKENWISVRMWGTPNGNLSMKGQPLIPLEGNIRKYWPKVTGSREVEIARKMHQPPKEWERILKKPAFWEEELLSHPSLRKNHPALRKRNFHTHPSIKNIKLRIDQELMRGKGMILLSMYQLNPTSKRAKGPTKLLIPSSVLNQNLNLNLKTKTNSKMQ